MNWIIWIAVIYFGIGASLALYSGTHFRFFLFFWPWPIAAEIVRIKTGEYPDWSPDL